MSPLVPARSRTGLWTQEAAANGSAATRSWPSRSTYSGIFSASVVSTWSKRAAVSRKSSKWTGSSLFQKTVGMPCSRQWATSSRSGSTGALLPVRAYRQAPPLPCHADSTKSRSTGAAASSSRQPDGVSSTCSHS